MTLEEFIYNLYNVIFFIFDNTANTALKLDAKQTKSGVCLCSTDTTTNITYILPYNCIVKTFTKYESSKDFTAAFADALNDALVTLTGTYVQEYFKTAGTVLSEPEVPTE
jgi:hypothetical protein